MDERTFGTLLYWIHQIVRYLAATAFVLSLVVAATHWGVRSKKISPFGAWARFVRRWGDPALKPVEVRILRAGGNPQDAPGWLIAAAVAAGLILITTVDFLISFGLGMYATVQSGTRGTLLVLIDLAFSLVQISLFIRVIGSWVGVGAYNRWMRPFYLLTDWIIIPIRRLIPTTGMVDFSPMLAIFLLLLIKSVLFRSLIH